MTVLHSYAGPISIPGMGHEAALEGPEWLPGELEALAELDPSDADELFEDDYLFTPDWDGIDLDALFGWETDRALDAEFDAAAGQAVGQARSGALVVARFSAAISRLCRAADELAGLATEPGVGLAGSDELIGWTQELQRVRNVLQVPDQALINLMEAADCRTDGPIGLFSTPHGFLSALVGIPIGEAKARVRAAELLAPTMDGSGERLPARYPVLAAAKATGEISPDRIDLLAEALTDWEKLLGVEGNNVSRETLAEAEELLAGQAKVLGGRQLGQVIDRVAGWLVPAGMLDDRPAQDAVRAFEVRQIQRGANRGMYRVEGRLTAEAGAKVTAVLDPLSKPQPVVDESGHMVERDHRDRGQRMHDAFEESMDRCLRAGDLPAHGGTPTTLILLAEEDEFMATAAGQAETGVAWQAESGAGGSMGRVADGPPGSAVTETGDVLPLELATALVDEAEVVRIVFDRQSGDILDLGRTRRLASYAQTLALAARDGGCTFPGCSKSPKWCQRHHIVDWARGGKTDLANLTLVCSFHHYRFARHGWEPEYWQGRVWWRPPKIIDPDQKPILNLRLRDYPLIT